MTTAGVADAADGGFETQYEDWQLVGDTYFSKRDLYTLQWGRHRSGSSVGGNTTVNFEFQRVFCASFGGPIALCRDETKVVLQLGAFSKPDIHIFSASGNPLGSVMWTGGRLSAAGWVGDEELLTVDDQGRVQRFTALGHPSSHAEPFSLGTACEEEGISEALVFDNGVVARTAAGHLWAVADAALTPHPRRLPSPAGPGSVIHTMAAVSPPSSASGSLEVLVAVDAGVVVVDASEAVPSLVSEGPIVRLAVSPDGSYVAGFAADGVIHVWCSRLEETKARVSVPDTAEDMSETLGVDASTVPWGPPESFVWCGSDGVVASWSGIGALLVTLDGEWRWWDVGHGPAVLVSEIDGVRAVTADTHTLLRRVPPALESVLEIGSTSPGALLHDARRLYEDRDARAAAGLLDVLKAGDLPAATEACLGAAAAEMDPSKQEFLLKAGCYGSAFLPLDATGSLNSSSSTSRSSQNTKAAAVLARKLRVLNALRDASLGLPLTMPQLEHLGPPRLAARLTGRRLYAMALCVCDVLGASRQDTLLRWACDKIAASASSASDEELTLALASKLEDSQHGQVKWALVASAARAQGRPRLAALLAERDAIPSDQVPLLLSLGEDRKALRRAADCGDPDLVFAVVHAGWRAIRRGDIRSGSGGASADAAQRFWEGIKVHPQASVVLARYLGAFAPEAEVVLWEALGQHEATAAHHIAAATSPPSVSPGDHDFTLREWNRARDAYLRAEKAGREDKFESGAAAAARRLLEVQAELQRSTGREGFVGLSVVDTIRICLKLGLREPAQKVAGEFKVSEKQQMLLALADAATKQDWAAMRGMAGRLDRRAPISMDHFVSAARMHDAPLEVTKWFIDRIVGDGALLRRAQLYADLGMEDEARALAEQAEMAGASSGVLGSLRDAVGGSLSFMKPVS